ncbi:sialate O-acetylesterase [Chryseobacterium oryctis]|uniref:Sialate O-acetylesterase n=1 Tax=Chryseobacterium oryctis TaxID=2952618 RepID=A0ABT3HM32_9FLAO|nr:sialate O-acetylesterase [Chryseobacterium oryctis]MCW3160845.1 sialate O-acetylesterase [Chryseobacterium oryctis]
MKKFIFALLVFVLGSCASNNLDEIQNENHTVAHGKMANTVTQYDIFLIAGQSNTHFGVGYDPRIDTTDPDIFQVGRIFPYNKQIIAASEPLQHWTALPTNIGFGLTFAKNYKKNSLKENRKVLLVPCGFGATPIELWEKGTPLYNDAVERTLKALNDNPGSTIKGILWHQGEFNVGIPNYTQKLDKLILDFRTDLGNPDLPVVLGGMVPFWTNLLSIRVTQQEKIKDTPNRVPKTAYADPTVPFVIKKPINSIDAIHFDANGQRELGLRYYNQYKTLE